MEITNKLQLLLKGVGMVTVFSSTGCIRCRIVKEYLTEHGVAYREYDVKTTEGSEAFKAFYREHRSSVRRDAQGIFFPVVQDDGVIVQDAGTTLAWFMQGEKRAGFVQPNNLGHGWTGGLRIPPSSAGQNESFLEIAATLKEGGLQTEVTADGDNAGLLEALLRDRLVDRLVFELRRENAALHEDGESELERSLKTVSTHAGNTDIRFLMDIAWFMEREAVAPEPGILGRVAEKVRAVTGTVSIPCLIDDGSRSVPNLFPYRTAVRRWIPRTELIARDDGRK